MIRQKTLHVKTNSPSLLRDRAAGMVGFANEQKPSSILLPYIDNVGNTDINSFGFIREVLF